MLCRHTGDAPRHIHCLLLVCATTLRSVPPPCFVFSVQAPPTYPICTTATAYTSRPASLPDYKRAVYDWMALPVATVSSWCDLCLRACCGSIPISAMAAICLVLQFSHPHATRSGRYAGANMLFIAPRPSGATTTPCVLSYATGDTCEHCLPHRYYKGTYLVVRAALS